MPRKAAASVGAGAGGHASIQSGFSLVREIRAFWRGCLILGGAINDGWQVRAAEALGADLAYVGTRFVASEESGASSDCKAMLLESEVSDLVYTDPDKLPPKRPDVSRLVDTEARRWGISGRRGTVSAASTASAPWRKSTKT
jgi:nitronate monooxygenase